MPTATALRSAGRSGQAVPPATSVRAQAAFLESLPEPVETLAALRALAAEHPATARAEAPRLLAAYAAERWAQPLAELAIPAEVVNEAFSSGRREIWLWVRGDRRFDQLSGWLAARVARRSRP